jgi:hypothetical protein
VPYANYAGQVRVAVYDANHDGSLDIVTGATSNADVRVFDSSGTFISITHPFPGGGVYVAGRN